jgi:DNA-binding transcriptional LysR family regulator
MIELTMPDAGSRGHPLDVAWTNRRVCASAVPMFQLAFKPAELGAALLHPIALLAAMIDLAAPEDNRYVVTSLSANFRQWETIVGKLASLRAFTKVVTKGGFSAAGQELGLSRGAVSKQVIELEESLGVRLLNRTTRKVTVTECGQAYFERCASIFAELEEADLAVSQLQAVPRGPLRINGPMSFGTLHLAPAIADFMLKYHDIQVQLILNDRFVDPVEDGFDVTVRIADLLESSLVARKIVPARRVVCAAPSYLDERGIPMHPNDLRSHDCVNYGFLAIGTQWKLTGSDGDHWIRAKWILCSNNAEVLLCASVKGLGIALLPSFIAGPALQMGKLRTVLTDYETPPLSVYAIYPPNRHLSARVRLFIDFLVSRFGGRPYWDLVA